MQAIFFNIVGISITVSIIGVALLLISSYLNERYVVKWRYFIWLILAIRLILPIDFGLTAPPLELNLADREIVYSVDESKRSDLAVPLSGDATRNENAGLEPKTGSEDGLASYNAEILAARKAAGKTISISQIAVIIYLIGVAAFLIWQFGLYLFFRKTTGRWCKLPEEPQTLEVFENLKIEMAVFKPLPVRICKKIGSPMIVGIFKPTLLLPHEEYQKIDLEMILKHELVHFRRNDLRFKLILILANALHWFNPIVYFLIKEANKDIEISCDEEALNGADLPLRTRYSEHILELMQGNHHREAPVSTNFYGGKGMIKSRIKNIFDTRAKKKGTISCIAIIVLVLIFSACQFAIAESNWQIPISSKSVDAFAGDTENQRNQQRKDFNIALPFDMDQDGIEETEFTLAVTESGSNCILNYKNENGKTVQTTVFNGVEPGMDYGIQAANMEDTGSIMILVSIDYRGMPFGAGYWELYSWKNGRFEKVDIKPIENRFMVKILTPSEIADNSLNAQAWAFLYDTSKYPADYPAAAIISKEDLYKGSTINGLDYAPMSEYDVEGFRTWGQDAINKTMTKMNLVSGAGATDWNDSTRALLETEEIVYITLPNITSTMTSYYAYQDGKWIHVDGYIK